MRGSSPVSARRRSQAGSLPRSATPRRTEVARSPHRATETRCWLCSSNRACWRLLLYLTRGRESAGLPTRTPGRKRSLLLLAAGPTQKDSRACLPLAYGRWPNTCAQDLRPCADRASAQGEGNRAREARWLPATATRSVQPTPEEVYALLPPEIRCVVGIDVATSAHVVCALEAPGGAPRLKSTPLPATAVGYAHLLAGLGAWGEPATLLLGLESTGSRWEPLYDALTPAGYTVLLLNPHQTASWATSLGLRAKTAGSDAHTLARGLLAGLARASTVPDETVQALRTLTRTRRDLVASQSAARQRVHDELVPVFPELVGHLPDHADLGAPAVLRLLTVYSSAQSLARAPLDALSHVLEEA